MPARKVGILNFQYSTHNFGAVLQAAALEYTLTALGYDARHIDFRAQPRVSFRIRLRRLIGRVLGPLKRRVRKLLAKVRGLEELDAPRAVGNQEAFEQFRRQFLTRTPRISTGREFRRVAGGFEAVVVGSDQVWRPQYAKDPVAFFLGYVPEDVDRIAYAASFGTINWEERDDTVLTARLGAELARFKAVSCREDSGVDICSEVFGVSATHVLDPLLLVEQDFFDHVGLAPPGGTRSKVVFYKLDPSDDFLDDLAALGRTFGSEPVNIYVKDGAERNYREVRDWLSLIVNSDVVITDSFHCICLGLRFGKQVIYCPNDRRGEARVASLLNMLNISTERCGPNLKTDMYRLITPSGMDATLARERERSLRFLQAAVAG